MIPEHHRHWKGGWFVFGIPVQEARPVITAERKGASACFQSVVANGMAIGMFQTCYYRTHEARPEKQSNRALPARGPKGLGPSLCGYRLQ